MPQEQSDALAEICAAPPLIRTAGEPGGLILNELELLCRNDWSQLRRFRGRGDGRGP
jgi:hypothetical protein